MDGKVFYMGTIGYFTDPVLKIQDPWLFYGVAGCYIILPENSHKNLNCTNAKNNSRKRIENFAIFCLEINIETTKNRN